MATTGIRLENCSDIIIDNFTGVGLDEGISAKNTKNLSATNIVVIDNAEELNDLIDAFNLLMQGKPFLKDIYYKQAEDVKVEIKKEIKDKKKLETFHTSLKNIYNYVDKGTKLGITILTLCGCIEKML